MESLSETVWDLVISGTGLAQSLLALSLSHSSKKVLHLDRNDYYGGAEAAFSLQEAEKWVKQINSDKKSLIFDAEIRDSGETSPTGSRRKLGPSRSYTLSLSPQLLYSQSALLPVLVSSRVHTQLEFQAVGSWWVYRNGSPLRDSVDAELPRADQARRLQKIPGGREDVFADNNLSVRNKRALMKFLRYILQEPGSEDPPVETFGDDSLASVLASKFNVPPALHQPLLALSLAHQGAESAVARLAMTRIRRHLRSIGVFGPGFGAMIPKYGGGAEIAQVGCRAGAVGGGVYVLGRGIEETHARFEPEGREHDTANDEVVTLKLSDGELVRTKYVAGGYNDLPSGSSHRGVPDPLNEDSRLVRSISIVSSPLTHLFPPTSENGPIPAGAVVIFDVEDMQDEKYQEKRGEMPTYLLVHSSDSGECPTGQSVIYGSTVGSDQSAKARVASAVESLLQTSVDEQPPVVLWSMSYISSGRPISAEKTAPIVRDSSGRILIFPPPVLDLAFDDSIIDHVKAIWEIVLGAEADEQHFMLFEDRGGVEDEEFD